MAWTEILNSGALQALGVVSRPMLASALYQGLQEGFSGASMLKVMRAAGVGIRTQNFYRALRSARAFEAAVGLSGAQRLASNVSEHLFGGGITSGGKGYINVVTVHYKQVVDGEELTLTKDIFIRSQENLTVGQVIQKAYEVWGVLQADEKYPLGEPVALEYIGTAG